MLSKPGASRSGNSGLVSSAKRRHLKPRHRKIPVSEHRSRTREHKLVHYTHRPIPDVVRRSRGPFTHLCRAERECKSAKVTLSPARTTVLSFRYWSGEKVVWDCLYLCAPTRARVSSRRNAALAFPHPRSLALRSRLLPRAVWACFLCAVVTCRYVRHYSSPSSSRLFSTVFDLWNYRK